MIVYLAAAPFTVILVHFKVHRPRESRALLAIVTGCASLALACVLAVAAWWISGPTL